MTDFTAYLRALGARLPIPEPARSRVLLEMAADRDDLLRHYLDQGKAPGEAAAAADAHFDLSEEDIRELVRVHSAPLQRSLEGLSAQARGRWERAMLAVVALVVAPGLVAHLVQPGLLADASLLAWLLLGILGLAVALGLWKAVALFGPAARTGGLAQRGGLRVLPGLAVLLMGAGFAGIWTELYRAALGIQAAPGTALRLLVEWLHVASATLVVALSGALLTALLWFFLEARAADLDQRAAAHVLHKEG